MRETLLKAGAKFRTENVFRLEFANGSRVLALPGTEDLIRGLTVDAWIVADEAARLANDLWPLYTRCGPTPEARFAMLSTAWSHTDPFWSAWAGDDHHVYAKATTMRLRHFRRSSWSERVATG